jgi:hypothetical protein
VSPQSSKRAVLGAAVVQRWPDRRYTPTSVCRYSPGVVSNMDLTPPRRHSEHTTAATPLRRSRSSFHDGGEKKLTNGLINSTKYVEQRRLKWGWVLDEPEAGADVSGCSLDRMATNLFKARGTARLQTTKEATVDDLLSILAQAPVERRPHERRALMPLAKRAFPFLTDPRAPPGLVELVASQLYLRAFEPGDVVYRQGDESKTEWFHVLDGAAEQRTDLAPTPQVRFCRDRFSATGDLGYRGVTGAEG